MKFVEVTINKPFGNSTYVAIRDTYIKQAIREGKWLRITIPQGVGEHDPKSWIKSGKRVEQVFKMPDHPMILYRNLVEVGKKYVEPKIEAEPITFNNALANTPSVYLNKMRAIFHK